MPRKTLAEIAPKGKTTIISGATGNLLPVAEGQEDIRHHRAPTQVGGPRHLQFFILAAA
jgi:hypothetical protein